MYGALNNNVISVRPIGYTVEVPNNDIARLMYYLSCVDTVINYGKEDMFTDYEHYYLLTGPERIELIKLVILFNPKFFIDTGIFIVDPSLVPYNCSNEFYEIKDNRINFNINEEIMIGGQYVKVLKIMACTDDWLFRNYINPLKNITNPPPPPQSKPTYYYNNTGVSVNNINNGHKKREDGKCCSIF